MSTENAAPGSFPPLTPIPSTTKNPITTNIMGYGQRHPLDAIFAPRSIALIGASEREGTVGRILMENLLNSPFKDKFYPVNLNHATILGQPAYPDLKNLPGPVDLAIIATPAHSTPQVIAECAAAGVKGAIILSAGFREIGPPGLELEQQVLAEARKGRVRIIGPNCLGVMCPHIGLNATFARPLARPGNVAFISQSGALCSAVLDWSLKEQVGFSAFISIGAMADVSWGDLISYLGEDSHTKSIVMYMETVGDARSFLSAAREVALSKPIIVIKPGRTQAAAQAAASHTGALTGSDEVLDAAFRRCGVMRVNHIADLFNLSEVLAKQPRPLGPRLTILTNAGGPGVLATDALIGGGGELAVLSAETITALNQFLPPHWSHGNPVDIIGDATPERFAQTLEVLTKNPNSDGLLVALSPQAMTAPTTAAEVFARYAKSTRKPVFASWMGGESVAAGQRLLQEAGIPTFDYPDTAARVFNDLWQYNRNLKSLYETPQLSAGAEGAADSRQQAENIIQAARQVGRTILSEYEAKQVLAVYELPVVETRLATNEAEAIRQAEDLGYPVAVKLHSFTITHKSEVNGVQLNLSGPEQVRAAYQTIQAAVSAKAGPEDFLGVTVQPMVQLEGYEVILGSSIDPQFGPVLLFGAGGVLVEVFKDRALGLPPLNTTLARRLMERTRIFGAFAGVRGRAPIALDALDKLLVQFSRLVVEQPFIKEIDINPLLVSEKGLLALDARIILHDPNLPPEDLPRLAIRPYPRNYILPLLLKDGTSVTLRPILPEDEPLIVKFHETLSERSVYFRYFHMLGLSQRIAHERLTRICFIDYDREMVLVGEYHHPETGQREILAVGRLNKLEGTSEAEFAVLVSDNWQGRGLGSKIVSHLLQIGRDEHLARIVGDVHPENRGMQAICRKLAFTVKYSIEDEVVKVSIDL